MIEVAFTGTQVGWSAKQYDAVSDWVWALTTGDPTLYRLHHGDCVGADANMHELCFEMGWQIMVHPPVDPKKRAFVHNTRFWEPERCEMLPEKPYLERNHDMVDVGGVLYATPKEKEEQLRSGTWATVRYAKKVHVPTILFYRDGTQRAA